jgi:hypothetical protein
MATTVFTPSRVPTQRRTPPSDKCELGCLYSVLCLHTRICAAKRVTSSADPVRDDSASSSEEVVTVAKKKGSGKAKAGKEKEKKKRSDKGSGTPKAKKTKYTGDIAVHLTQGT